MTSPGSQCGRKGLHSSLYDDLFKSYGTLQDSSSSGFKIAAENPDGTSGINVNIYLCLLDMLRSIKKLVANTFKGGAREPPLGPRLID